VTNHTLALIIAALLVADFGYGLADSEKYEWTPRKVFIDIPVTVFAIWLVVQILF